LCGIVGLIMICVLVGRLVEKVSWWLLGDYVGDFLLCLVWVRCWIVLFWVLIV